MEGKSSSYKNKSNEYKELCNALDELVDNFDPLYLTVETTALNEVRDGSGIYKGFIRDDEYVDEIVAPGFALERAYEILYQEKAISKREMKKARQKILKKYLDRVRKPVSYVRGPRLEVSKEDRRDARRKKKLDLATIYKNADYWKTTLEFEKKVRRPDDDIDVAYSINQVISTLDFIRYMIAKTELDIDNVAMAAGFFLDSPLPPRAEIEEEKKIFKQLIEAWYELVEWKYDDVEEKYERALKEVDNLFEKRLRRQ